MEQDYESLLNALNRARFLFASTDTPSTFNIEQILQLNEDNLPKSKASQCNVTWVEGDIAYKCRDCQFDSTWLVTINEKYREILKKREMQCCMCRLFYKSRSHRT